MYGPQGQPLKCWFYRGKPLQPWRFPLLLLSFFSHPQPLSPQPVTSVQEGSSLARVQTSILARTTPLYLPLPPPSCGSQSRVQKNHPQLLSSCMLPGWTQEPLLSLRCSHLPLTMTPAPPVNSLTHGQPSGSQASPAPNTSFPIFKTGFPCVTQLP